MKIGFIGFGEVNQKLAELLKNEILLTSNQNRSINTINNIKNSKIEVLPTFKEVAIQSDILFSATSPKTAVDVAQKYGRYCKGLFIDLNNISPDSSKKIEEMTNFIKGAIIGSINRDFVLFLAGENVINLEFLNNHFPIKIISNNSEDVSKIKLLRSIYTKAVAVTLIETTSIAKDLGIYDELLDVIALTEGEKFKSSAISRINNTKNNSKRKEEEMLEILDYFKDYDLEITEATLKKLSNI